MRVSTAGVSHKYSGQKHYRNRLSHFTLLMAVSKLVSRTLRRSHKFQLLPNVFDHDATKSKAMITTRRKEVKMKGVEAAATFILLVGERYEREEKSCLVG